MKKKLAGILAVTLIAAAAVPLSGVDVAGNTALTVSAASNGSETIEVHNIGEFKTEHNLPTDTDKTWKYTIPGAKAVKITFSENTNFHRAGLYSSDYISIGGAGSGFHQTFYGDTLAGKSVTVRGDTIEMRVVTMSSESYGFDVVEAVEGDVSESIDPVIISNSYIGAIVDKSGTFSIGTVTDKTKFANNLLFGYTVSNSFLFNTSNATVSVDGTRTAFVPEKAVSVDDKTVVATGHVGNIEVVQTVTFEKNLATGRDDVAKITYKYTNNDTVSHETGCKILLDTMIGDNDKAPFRVPGVGDITRGTKFLKNDMPAYWQAFDDIESPKVIAQGRFYKNESEAPDMVLFGNYIDLNASKWDEKFSQNVENGDSAVGIFWNERTLKAGRSVTYTTYYGLSDLTQDNSGKVGLSFTGDTFAAQVDYLNDLPVYNEMIYTAYLHNLTNDSLSNVKASIQLPEGFELVDASGNSLERTVASLPKGKVTQIDWRVKIDPTKVKPSEVYDVSVNMTNGDESKTLTRKTHIPETLTEKTDISAVDISDVPSQVYTGGDITPEITLTNGSSDLVEGANYTVEYKNNLNVGTAQIIIKGIGMYKGSVTVEFEITAKDIANMDISLNKDSFTYNGTTQKPVITIKDGERKLTEGVDYTVTSVGSAKVGTASATIKGIGNYLGSVIREYTIEVKELKSSAVSLSKTAFTYNGKVQRPVITVKDGTKTLKSTDYKVTYSEKNSKKPGVYTIKVSGIGNYGFTKNATYTIAPANVKTVKAVKSVASSVKLSWSKVQGASGYVVYQQKSGKWVKVMTTKTAAATVSKLKAGTNYKFAVKAFVRSDENVVASASFKSAVVSTTPAKVKLTAKAGKRKAALKWNKVTGATAYRVYFKSASGKWKLVKTTAGKSFTKTGLKKGKKYSFKVVAVRKANGKTYTSTAAVKTVKSK